MTIENEHTALILIAWEQSDFKGDGIGKCFIHEDPLLQLVCSLYSIYI